jgi:16S rRNA (uracil1498-N3)-methyltransferase
LEQQQIAMQVFYSTDFSDKQVILGAEEYRHCVKVLRKSVGDAIEVTDGKGKLYSCVIDHIAKSELTASIRDTHSNSPHPYRRAIAIAPTKNADRIEFFVEKSIEIGIDVIALVFTEKTERSRINLDRIHKIAVSAMKQSLSFYLPELLDFKEVNTAFAYFQNYEQKAIAHCRDASQPASDFFQSAVDSVIFIGPEGDFSEAEVELARQAGYTEVHLGPTRLRTETAGIVSAVWLNATK